MIFFLLAALIFCASPISSMELDLGAQNQQNQSSYTVDEIERLLNAYIDNPNHQDGSHLAPYIKEIVAEQRALNKKYGIQDTNKQMFLKMKHAGNLALLVEQLITFEKLSIVGQLPDEVLARMAFEAVEALLNKKRQMSFYCMHTWDTKFDTPQLQEANIYNIAISPDGSLLAFIFDVNIIHIYNLSNYKLVQAIEHAADIFSVALSEDNSTVVFSDSNNIYVHNINTNQQIATLPTDKEEAHCLLFNKDGTRLISGHEDDAIIIWDLVKKEPIRTIATSRRILSLAWYNDQKGIICCQGNSLDVYELSSGKQIKSFKNKNHINVFALTPDGNAVVFCDDTFIKLWDFSDKAKILAAQGALELVVNSEGVIITNDDLDNSLKLGAVLDS